MRLLLDTHALLWAVTDPNELAAEARAQIGSGEVAVFVSLVSLWELRIKESIGKLALPEGFYASLQPAGYDLLPVSLEHIDAYGRLPLLHRDPFDRMLVAQASTDRLTLVSRDPDVARYGIAVLKA